MKFEEFEKIIDSKKYWWLIFLLSLTAILLVFCLLHIIVNSVMFCGFTGRFG